MDFIATVFWQRYLFCYTLLQQFFNQLLSRHGFYFKYDNIGFHCVRVKFNNGQFRQRLGQDLRMFVIFSKPLAVMVKGIERAGCDDARLAESTSELLLEAPGPLDEVCAAHQSRTHRCAQTLAEAHTHRVERCGVLRLGHTGGGDGVPEPGTVHMEGHAVASTRRGCVQDRLHGPHHTATDVVRAVVAAVPVPGTSG